MCVCVSIPRGQEKAQGCSKVHRPSEAVPVPSQDGRVEDDNCLLHYEIELCACSVCACVCLSVCVCVFVCVCVCMFVYRQRDMG